MNSVLFACTAFLAVEPIIWLGRTWFDASWGSYGEWIFGVVALLAAWSVTSPSSPGGARTRHAPALLFALTAVVRVAGHVLAINVVGALALVIDVYALGLLFGLHRRRRAVSPFWLAALFALALPLEKIVQRVVGFGLQQVSAAGACGALSAGFDGVQCNGVDIVLNGTHVLVDLPCSGARGLLLTCAAFVGVAAVTRPSVGRAAAGLAVTLAAALLSNTLRIIALAIGLAFPEVVGVDVMAQPWHDIVGLSALGLGLAPIVAWARSSGDGAPLHHAGAEPHAPKPAPKRLCAVETAELGRGALSPRGAAALRGRRLVAAALLAACLAVLLTPHQPVDVAREVDHLETPTWLAGHRAERDELSEQEENYFTQFGGAAAKSRYGARTLLLVQTSAPLRHLHAPDECLRGAGFDVQRLGISHGVLPGATYRAEAPDGQMWRVIVTYRSDAGHVATSVSEAVWLWIRNPDTTWTAIERAHPWHAPRRHNQAFDDALKRSLEL